MLPVCGMSEANNTCAASPVKPLYFWQRYTPSPTDEHASGRPRCSGSCTVGSRGAKTSVLDGPSYVRVQGVSRKCALPFSGRSVCVGGRVVVGRVRAIAGLLRWCHPRRRRVRAR